MSSAARIEEKEAEIGFGEGLCPVMARKSQWSPWGHVESGPESTVGALSRSH